jgi:hypothetical protein
MLKIFSDKNVDYGDSFKEDGVVGLVIRLGDKLKRLKTISDDGHVIQVTDEGLWDTLLDIANYSAMGLMLLKEKVDAEAGCRGDKSELLQQSKDDTKKSTCSCGACSPPG